MRRTIFSWVFVLLMAAFIKIFSLFPEAVEKYYSNGLYLYISHTQRKIFGWLSFSVGDLLYSLAIVYLAIGLFKMIRTILKKKADRKYWTGFARKAVFAGVWIYVLFNFFWGLNYNRVGIARQWKLDIKEVKSEEIKELMGVLLQRVNEYDSLAKLNRAKIENHSYLFTGAMNSYGHLAGLNPIMEARPQSIKSSLFSSLGNYLGYTGYYNPFTGEAQVNTAVPLFIQPFTACHEIGHQLGYAKENEANFSGYLSAKCSTDPVFLYSVYFDLYTYGRPYLLLTDSMYLRKLDSQLVAGVKKDYKELRQFYLSHENPIEDVIDKLYGQFLKANQQPAGKITYGQVILWLVAYYRQFGKQAI